MPKALAAKRTRVQRTEQTVQVPDLTGGQNLRVSPTLVPSEQARETRNWSLEEPGALTVRLGHVLYSSSSVGAGRGQGGQRVYTSSRVFTLFGHGTKVFTVADNGTPTQVLTGLSTNQVYFPYDRQIVAVFDGTNRPKKSTDGSSWTNFGIDQPAAGPTASTLSSGACSSGEYAFAYSYKQRSLAYEGNISSGSTITLTGTTGAFHLAAAASTEAHVDAYVWYAKDISAGETVFRKVSSGADSTFRVTDTNWTSGDEAPTNHTVLATGRFGVIWKNRWWIPSASVGNRLHFSEIFLPQAFPADFYIDIPFERGDTIAAVVPLGDTLIVFGQSKVFIIFGQTSLDFEVRASAGAIAGAFGPRAVAVVEQGVLHASVEGTHIFDGASDRLLTHDIAPAIRDVISNAAAADLDKLPMVYETRRKCLRMAVPRVYPRATPGEWELNLDRSRGGEAAWCNTDRAIGGYIQFDGNEQTAGLRGELVTWNDTSGLLFKESTGTSANSSNMTAEYEGPTLSLGLHRSRVLGLHVDYEPHAGALTSETLVDGVSQGGISLTIGAGLATYGTAIYGTATYGGSGRRKAYTPQRLSAEGRTITHKLTYAGQERAKIYSYAYDIVPETRPRTFSE